MNFNEISTKSVQDFPLYSKDYTLNHQTNLSTMARFRTSI